MQVNYALPEKSSFYFYAINLIYISILGIIVQTLIIRKRKFLSDFVLSVFDSDVLKMSS